LINIETTINIKKHDNTKKTDKDEGKHKHTQQKR